MEKIIKEAFLQAQNAREIYEIPVGAVIFDPDRNNAIIAACHNMVYSLNDATAHAEILAIRNACTALKSPRLDGLSMYVTLEPCAMCAGAIAHSSLKKLYYGAYDIKAGAVDHGVQFFNQSSCLHKIEVYSGINEKEASAMMKSYFKKKRL